MSFQFEEVRKFIENSLNEVQKLLDETHDVNSSFGYSISDQRIWEFISMLEMSCKSMKMAVMAISHLQEQELRYKSGSITTNEYAQYQQVMQEFEELNAKVKGLETKLKHSHNKNAKLREENKKLTQSLKESAHNIE